MRKFNISKLPEWASDRIDTIEWNADNGRSLVWLKEGFAFSWDYSHCEWFESKSDLLSVISEVVIDR